MTEFLGGALVERSEFSRRTFFDVANNLITAQFDGMGNISKYAVMNKFCIFEQYRTLVTVNGTPIDFYAPKTVTMQGRRQITKFAIGESCSVTITQFLDNLTTAIYTQIDFVSETAAHAEVVINVGVDMVSYLKELFASRLTAGRLLSLPFRAISTFSKKAARVSTEFGSRIIRNDLAPEFYLDVAGDDTLTPLETNGRYCNQWCLSAELTGGVRQSIRYVVCAGSRGDYTHYNAAERFSTFDTAAAEAQSFIDSITYPDSIQDDFTRAFYHNLTTCCLSNYKELGDFRGFLAGIVYQFPCRTYFRDSYWTVLSALRSHPQWVRNEILTLASGIDSHGKCPSAVKYNKKNWWGNHYDSPSFFCIEVYDYIVHTGDESILREKWRGKTLFDAMELTLGSLICETDSSGLLVKSGTYNRRDWCDNVFRTGYVTYDEALYARALFAMRELHAKYGDKALSEKYDEMYGRVVRAIDEYLWDEERGYYVNYRDGDYTEDNLSIDTVVMPLFGICSEEHSRRVLSAMERLLESRNNHEQKAGDFGTLSVYPFYKNPRAVVLKSTLPYYYHNGGDWPYWSAVYAYAKLMYGMDYTYPLTRWFTYNLSRGNYTPVEFFSPCHPDGSLLQAWSSAGAFVYNYADGTFFTRTLGNS